ncbi:hypothetical protein KEM56_006830, partial [Ascosphaera pollenicola]
TGRSENDRDLRADLKRWINMGDNAVRLVLLVNVTTTLLKVTAYMPGTQPGRVGHGGEITARRRGDRFRVRAGARIRLPFVNLFFREMRPGEREFELWGSDLEEASASLVEALSDLSDQHRQRPQKHLKASLAQVELDQTFSVDTLPDKKKRKKEVTMSGSAALSNPGPANGNDNDANNAPSSSSAPAKPLPPLPNIRMLDPAALTSLLSANTCPPEINSILLFASNGAIFAHSLPSPLPTRQLRSLAATYGAAFTSYATISDKGNLTGVSVGAHPSSYVTAVSEALLRSRPRMPGHFTAGDTSTAATSVYDGVENTTTLSAHRTADSVAGASASASANDAALPDNGSAIAFDDGENIAVVTKITGHILLAVIGPCNLNSSAPTPTPLSPQPPAATTPLSGMRRGSAAWPFSSPRESQREQSATGDDREGQPQKDESPGLLERLKAPSRTGLFRRSSSALTESSNGGDDSQQRHQSQVQTHQERENEQSTSEATEDRDYEDDLDRLASLNLSASPEVMLALESKCAALGRFLGRRLRGLVCPDDF